MSDTAKLSILEVQKIFKRPGIYIGILFSILAALSIAYMGIKNQNVFQTRHVQGFFANVAEIVLFIYAISSLGDDFRLGTTTNLFTSLFSRGKVIVSKLISIMMVGFILGLTSGIIVVISGYFMGNNITFSSAMADILRNCGIYTLVGFFIGAFSNMMILYFLNMAPVLVMYIALFWVVPRVIDFIVIRFEGLRSIAELIPFNTSSFLLAFQELTINKVIGLGIGGLILLIISLNRVNKIDL